MTLLTMLGQFGYGQKAPGKYADQRKNPVSAWNMHRAVYLTLDEPEPVLGPSSVALEHYGFLREMRNAQIHNGGMVSQRLADEVEPAWI